MCDMFKRSLMIYSVVLGSSVALSGQVEDVDNASASEIVSEASLIEAIESLQGSGEGLDGDKSRMETITERRADLVRYVDMLLKRYPDTKHREQALIAKLEALATLARIHPNYLNRFLTYTYTLEAKDDLSPLLASEVDFFAIQAFVLGARREGMPVHRRMQGTLERYEAFVENRKTSRRLPIVWASLIRTAIRLKKLEFAQAQFEELSQQFPDHQATRRASGELFRETGIGELFEFTYPLVDGGKVSVKDFSGKVVLVHFWAFTHSASMEDLKRLAKLEKMYGEHGLQLIAISLDQECGWLKGAKRMTHMDWPIVCEGDGVEGEVAMRHGVTRLPAYYLIDKDGVYQAVEYSADQVAAHLPGLLGLTANKRSDGHVTGTQRAVEGGSSENRVKDIAKKAARKREE